MKNVTPNNGRVGVWGTSYPGWLTLAALRDPHPALAAAVPFNPVVDVWKADDWFHWGAFRAGYAFDFIYSMETRKGASVGYPYETRDAYAWLLAQGSAAALGRHLDERHEMWPRLMDNPAYGPYWKDCAADRWFPSPKRLVPTLHVHGFWDQEDIYGAPAAYAALEAHDRANDLNYFAAGPWYHGQHFADGARLGPLAFDEDTSKRFREDVLDPFLRRFLKGERVQPPAPATVFETGANRWRRFERWPPAVETRRLYLQPGGRLGFEPPGAGDAATEYVSDPKKPVPHAPRPQWGYDYDNPAVIAAWRRWLVEDQRFVDGRPDVATWLSEPLDRTAHDPRCGQGAPLRRDHGQRRRLGRQADRRLSRRRPGRPRDVGLPADGQRRHLPRPLSRELRAAEPARPGPGARVRDPAAAREPHVRARTPADGAGAEQLVPALRPQPADLGAVDHDGAARVVPRAAPPRPPRPGARDAPRAAGRHGRALAGGRAQRAGAPVALQSRRLR